MSVHRLNGLSICTLPKSVFVVHVLKAQKVSNYIPDHSEVFFLSQYTNLKGSYTISGQGF